jgi:hypothetical protein
MLAPIIGTVYLFICLNGTETFHLLYFTVVDGIRSPVHRRCQGQGCEGAEVRCGHVGQPSYCSTGTFHCIDGANLYFGH